MTLTIYSINLDELNEIVNILSRMQKLNKFLDFHTHSLPEEHTFSLYLSSQSLTVHADSYKIVITDVDVCKRITLLRDNIGWIEIM